MDGKAYVEVLFLVPLRLPSGEGRQGVDDIF